jgi:hypothetical protein
MSETLFLINPKHKRKRKRMPAGLRKYWATHRRGRRKNSRRRRKVYLRRRNPARAHRRHRRRRNPSSYHRRHRRRRNPFGGGEIKNVIVPAAIGAAGAIALAVAYGYASPSLPSSITSVSFASPLLQAAGAIGLGFLASKFLGKQQGSYVAMGGLTVVLVNLVTPYISSATGGSIPGMSGFGGLKLGGVGDYIPYRRPGMGAYLRTPARLGFINPAPKFGAYMRNPVKMGAYLAKSIPGMRGFGHGYTGLSQGDGM